MSTANEQQPQQRKPRKVVCVTGGTGFIGGHIIEKFLREGHDVRTTVRDPSSDRCNFLKKIAEETDAVKASGGTLSFFKADLCVPGSFDAAFQGADIVVHSAALVKNDFEKSPYEIIDPGVQGAAEVSAAANRAGTVKRIVFTGSIAAVMQKECDRRPDRAGKPFDESEWRMDLRPHYAPYEAEKALSERTMYERFNGEVVTIMPALVVGPLQHSECRASMTVMRMLANREYPVAPAIKSPAVDVRDVALAHYCAAWTELPDKHARHCRFLCCAPNKNGERLSHSFSAANFSPVINRLFPHLNAPEIGTPSFVLSAMKYIDKRVSQIAVDEYMAEKPPFDVSRILSHLDGFKFHYTDMNTMVRDSVQSMIDFGIVAKPPKR